MKRSLVPFGKSFQKLSDETTHFYSSICLGAALNRFPQKNSLLSNFPICHFELVFFYKLRKLSLFPILDNALHSSSRPQTTRLCVKVFASHTGHWYRITVRHHFKGYRQKMKEKRFLQCIVTAPLSNKVTSGLVIKF